MTEAELYDTNRPNLCAALRWKGMFVWAEPDPTAQRSNTAIFWCLQTQTSLGPDGKVAEPAKCDGAGRSCHCAELTQA
ncbi:MAG TPA: hypothetical protein VFC61_05265 [Blastocatellia bacterium]|nr:hypothetical protein [Blastocatellia bacterium]